MTIQKVEKGSNEGRPLFLSVAEQANELGISEVTLYRAIAGLCRRKVVPNQPNTQAIRPD